MVDLKTSGNRRDVQLVAEPMSTNSTAAADPDAPITFWRQGSSPVPAANRIVRTLNSSLEPRSGRVECLVNCHRCPPCRSSPPSVLRRRSEPRMRLGRPKPRVSFPEATVLKDGLAGVVWFAESSEVRVGVVTAWSAPVDVVNVDRRFIAVGFFADGVPAKIGRSDLLPAAAISARGSARTRVASHDGWSRRESNSRPTGSCSSVVYQLCGGMCPPPGRRLSRPESARLSEPSAV